MKSFIATIVILTVFGVSSVQADVRLTFGVYTSDKPTTMVKKFRPILNALEKALAEKLHTSVHIHTQVARNYDTGIDDLVCGKVDFARMGPASYITSKDRNPNLKLLAMESNKGTKTFYGIICVPEKSSLIKVDQLKGRTFAFGDENSTIGRYLSQQLLVNNGVYAGDLAGFKYLGRHDRVGTAVGMGNFDAGALKESTFKALREKGVKIRELARFPNVTKPWVASSNMRQDIVAAFKEVLIGLRDRGALNVLKKDGFLLADESDYDLVRVAMQNNSTFFQKTTNP